jgi:peptidoglycan/xylan/chitin deacetylase (PgdA/CDA1 family)
MAIREHVKRIGERTLVASGVAGTRRRLLRDGRLILGYHNVMPDGATPGTDASLHLPRRAFAEQLDLLMQTHRIVSLSELLSDRPVAGGQPIAAITFDDAYRGALTTGVDELARRGLTATIFVAPAFIGGGSFWWDEIDWPAGTPEGDAFRQRALDDCRGDRELVLAMAQASGLGTRAVPDHARCAGVAELRDAVARGVVQLASHTWSHPNLAALDEETLTRELVRPMDWLRPRFRGALPVLAYPYGKWSDRVARAASAAGYVAALRVDGGWLRSRASAPYAAPRFAVPAGLSAAGFALRASGLFCH